MDRANVNATLEGTKGGLHRRDVDTTARKRVPANVNMNPTKRALLAIERSLSWRAT